MPLLSLHTTTSITTTCTTTLLLLAPVPTYVLLLLLFAPLHTHTTTTSARTQTLSKRQVKQTRSLLGMLLWHTDNSTDVNNKAKNICQTELLVDLRESIMQLSRHFQSVDPRNHKLV